MMKQILIKTKLVCIDVQGVSDYSLTVGKIYELERNYDVYGGPLEYGDTYCIKDDCNRLTWVKKKFFKPLQKIREEKLKELGI